MSPQGFLGCIGFEGLQGASNDGEEALPLDIRQQASEQCQRLTVSVSLPVEMLRDPLPSVRLQRDPP